jgi:hypothetical protein
LRNAERNELFLSGLTELALDACLMIAVAGSAETTNVITLEQ